jgi:hypothetical protein
LAFGFLVPEFKKKLCGSDFQRWEKEAPRRGKVFFSTWFW